MWSSFRLDPIASNYNSILTARNQQSVCSQEKIARDNYLTCESGERHDNNPVFVSEQLLQMCINQYGWVAGLPDNWQRAKNWAGKVKHARKSFQVQCTQNINSLNHWHFEDTENGWKSIHLEHIDFADLVRPRANPQSRGSGKPTNMLRLCLLVFFTVLVLHQVCHTRKVQRI